MNTHSQPEPTVRTVSAPWWRGAAIYQIYPRSFFDSNGDGIGDLPGIVSRLEHVASLGVDGIWLSPFFTSPMRDGGYDISDYCAVDPIFGTLDDFDRLVEKAHRLGLKVIIDQVYSHTSDQHGWFRESRRSRDNNKANWYVWADAKPDGAPPNNWQSVFGGPAWTWDARRTQYYLHNFLDSQPDLDLHNPAVQDALLATGRFWLERGVDGFRLDAINFSMHDPSLRDNPPDLRPGKRTRPFDFQRHIFNQSHPGIIDFLARMRSLTDSFGPGCFTVAEVGGEDADREMKAFTGGERRLNSAYNFAYLYASRLTPELVVDNMTNWPGRPDEGWPSWAFSNHDAPRAVSRWAPAERREAMAKLCLLLLATLRGNIFIYQGEELGLPQAEVAFERLRDPEAIANWPETLGRDGARTPMPWSRNAPFAGFSSVEPWLPVFTPHIDLAVSAQESDPASVLHFARATLATRKARASLRTGDLEVLRSDAQALVFLRHAPGQRSLCAFNLTDTVVEIGPLPGYLVALSTGSVDLAAGRLGPLSGVIADAAP